MIKKVDYLPIIILMLFLSAINLDAQVKTEEYYLADRLTRESGLPDPDINGICFDDKGFAWIGTFGGGISRYDGEAFINFSTHASPEHRLVNDYVTQSCTDDYARLWVAETRNIDVIDLKTLTICSIPDEIRSSYEGSYISSVTKDSEGCIWYNSRNKVFRISFENDGKEFKLDSIVCSTSDFNLRLNLFDIEKDGSVWVTLGGGIHRIKYEGTGLKDSRIFPYVNIGEDNKGTSCIKDGDNVWLGTLKGLYRINVITGEFTVFRQNDQSGHTISNDEVTSLCISPKGEIAAATLGGVDIYDHETGSFIEYSSRANIFGNKILPGNLVRCIATRGPQLWAGLEVEGLSILQEKNLPIINLSYRENEPASLPETPIRSMFTDSRGQQWFGATEYGLYLRTGLFTFRCFNTGNSSLSHNTITSFCEDNRGRLWIGSAEGKVNYLDINAPTRINVPAGSESRAAKKLDIINMMTYDQTNDFIWFASRTGLFYYNLGDNSFGEYFEPMFLCLSVSIDDKDRLWVSHLNGMKVIDLKDLQSVSNLDLPQSISIVHHKEDIWLGTFDNGVWKIPRDYSPADSIVKYNRQSGLPDDNVRGLLMDGDILWITSENGLFRLDISTGKMNNYGISDGLKSMAFCENSLSKDRNGVIYLGQKEGLSVLLSSFVTRSTYPKSNVVISGGFDESRFSNLVYEEKIRIHERDRNYTFSFSDLTFNNDSDIIYESRMLHFDNRWVPVYGNGKYVRYGNISGGSYKLQIRAVDNNGDVLSEDEIDVNVTPYFYKTWWFYILYALAGALVIQLFIHWRTESIKRKKELLQEEVKKQTELLSEQKQQIQEKANELAKQNSVLLKQNEELAGHKTITQEIDSLKTKFNNDLMNTIQKLYRDPELDIYSFADAMGMSRSVFNEKLQAATGQSIAQFIRLYRLNVAKEMITNGLPEEMTVSEIAYDVGFNDPKYFTRCFTKQFGVAPSVMMNESG